MREFWKYLKDEDGAVTGVKRSLGSKEEGEQVGFTFESDEELDVDDSVRKYVEVEYIRVQKQEDEEGESAGSESDPSGDNMDEEERRKRLQKKKKKTKKKKKRASGGSKGGSLKNISGGGGGLEERRAKSALDRLVPQIPVGENFRKPKRPEGRKTRRSFESLTSKTPRASVSSHKEVREFPPGRRAVSAGGAGSSRALGRRRSTTVGAPNEDDPRFVTVRSNVGGGSRPAGRVGGGGGGGGW